MRDINRIPKVLSAIENEWKSFPDMRFFQFVLFLGQIINQTNERPPDFDLFYLEDEELLRILKTLKE